MSGQGRPAGGSSFPGWAKVKFCQRMQPDNWRDLADLFDVSPADRARFTRGDEARSLWELVEARGQLDRLPDLLDGMGRAELSLLLRQSREAAEQPTLALPPVPQQDLNTLFFDLEEIRHVLMEDAEQLRQRRRSTQDAQASLAPFVLTHRDSTVADRICEWLPHCYYGIACKPKITLGPLVTSVDAQVARMARFRAELEHSDVACHVYGVDAPTKTITTFFERLASALDGARRCLVVIVTAAPGVRLPDTLPRLPEPGFRRSHVTLWAQRIVVERGWQPGLATAWAGLVSEYAVDVGEMLHIGRAYEALEQSINDLLTDEAGFRRDLEKRMSLG
ncbi:hypothetical protein AB0J85_14470 [Micromonospora echinofusca]|uniref:hypothetical protein n=1 Tax=Micromonospora echinofusca TaxID=47858 RepID=UPI003424B97B